MERKPDFFYGFKVFIKTAARFPAVHIPHSPTLGVNSRGQAILSSEKNRTRRGAFFCKFHELLGKLFPISRGNARNSLQKRIKSAKIFL